MSKGKKRPSRPELAPEPSPRSPSRWIRSWKIIVFVTVLIGGLVGFFANALVVNAERARRARAELAASLLRDVANYLAFGEVSEAKAALDSSTIPSDAETSAEPDFQLAKDLTQGFADEQSQWDSDIPDKRTALRDHLKRLVVSTSPPIAAELLALLSYRLPPSGGQVSTYVCPATYFHEHVSVFSTPYGRYLMARESHASDPAWSRDILDKLVLDATLSGHCRLQLQIRAWLAKMCLHFDDFSCAHQQLDRTDELISECRVKDPTLEVRVRGESLRLARRANLKDVRNKERSLLSGITHRRERQEDIAAATNAFLHLAVDSFYWRDYAAAKDEANSGHELCETSANLRGNYPYACCMLAVFWTGSNLLLDAPLPTTDQTLETSATSLRGMSGGPFPSDESLVQLFLSLDACRNGDPNKSSQNYYAKAMEYRTAALNDACGSRVFDYAEEWKIVEARLRHRQCL